MAGYRLDKERAAAAGLSARECEVLLLAAAGLNSREIGLRLRISDVTVRSHVARIARRLGAVGQLQLGAQALELGILYADSALGAEDNNRYRPAKINDR